LAFKVRKSSVLHELKAFAALCLTASESIALTGAITRTQRQWTDNTSSRASYGTDRNIAIDLCMPCLLTEQSSESGDTHPPMRHAAAAATSTRR
jgi:hypothetical protein